MGSHRLAIFIRVFDESYQRAQKSQFYERAHVHRFTVVEFDAKNDAEIQLQQIQSCIRGAEATRPQVLFVCPVRESYLQSVARESGRLGIGWVSVNRSCDYVTELRRLYPKVAYLCVDPDQKQVGRLQGQQLRTLLPGGGDVFYLHGPLTTSSARLRMGAFETEVAGGALRVVAHGGDWTEDSGYAGTKTWLRSLANASWAGWAVCAQNDAMAFGASRALAEDAAHRKRPEALPPIVGCDGLINYGQRLVLEETLAATVVVPPTTGKAVDEVAGALHGGRMPTGDLSVGVTSFPAVDTLAHTRRKPPKRP